MVTIAYNCKYVPSMRTGEQVFILKTFRDVGRLKINSVGVESNLLPAATSIILTAAESHRLCDNNKIFQTRTRKEKFFFES